MTINALNWSDRYILLETHGTVCRTTRELLASPFFVKVLRRYLQHLRRKDSPLLDLFPRPGAVREEEEDKLVALLQALGSQPLDRAVAALGCEDLAKNRDLLLEFVESLYDYWRRFDRFLICYSEGWDGLDHDQQPYTTFNHTVEQLTHLVRAAYRDVCENISGDHPRVYRQVAAGARVGLIAVTKDWPCPGGVYRQLRDIPFIRQMLFQPPLILDPPMNKRTGEFSLVEKNPLAGMELDRSEWLCYPAKVGPLVIFIYFHRSFMDLGCSLANLFEVARDEEIAAGPDAVYVFGAPPASLAEFGSLPTVFHEDGEAGLLVAAVPGEEQYGYFGYLKKMVLTLHNVVMMQKLGRMPFHGAMVRVVLKGAAAANVVIIGDTGAGKSESLEAFRILGDELIRDLRVVADDMGSLEVDHRGSLRGYGTEIGAFVRLDDLQPGYAFNQIDRAIIMSPQKINARAVMPVTTMVEVLKGYPVNYLLYANNYEEIDRERPILEQFSTVEEALAVFRKGKVMSKGTTTSTGLNSTYFANIFGAPQYRDLHEKLAQETFAAAFEAGVYVGQLRTRLGLPGYELKGPEEAARALIECLGQMG